MHFPALYVGLAESVGRGGLEVSSVMAAALAVMPAAVGGKARGRMDVWMDGGRDGGMDGWTEGGLALYHEIHSILSKI